MPSGLVAAPANTQSPLTQVSSPNLAALKELWQGATVVSTFDLNDMLQHVLACYAAAVSLVLTLH